MKKKWLIFIVVIAFVVLWQAWTIYQHIELSKTAGDQAAITKAKKTFDLTHINQVTSFRGKVDFHVVSATDDLGNNVYIWVPDSKKDGHLFLKKASMGVTKSQVLKEMKSKFPYNKIFSVDLGVKDQQPIWAVTYLDKNNHYTVTYFEYTTGEEGMTIIIT